MSEMFEVKKGVPVTDVRRQGPTTKYPWDRMEITDSFDAPVPEGKSAEAIRMAILNSVKNYRYFIQSKTYKITTSTATPGIVRVWRIA